MRNTANNGGNMARSLTSVADDLSVGRVEMDNSLVGNEKH